MPGVVVKAEPLEEQEIKLFADVNSCQGMSCSVNGCQGTSRSAVSVKAEIDEDIFSLMSIKQENEESFPQQSSSFSSNSFNDLYESDEDLLSDED